MYKELERTKVRWSRWLGESFIGFAFCWWPRVEKDVLLIHITDVTYITGVLPLYATYRLKTELSYFNPNYDLYLNLTNRFEYLNLTNMFGA